METTLRITGMKCGGCSSSVTEALEAVAGVESAEVSLERGEARISGNADAAALVAAVEAAGFGANAA